MGVQLAVPGMSPEERDHWLLMAGLKVGERCYLVGRGGGPSRASLACWEVSVRSGSSAPLQSVSQRGLIQTGLVMRCTVFEVLVWCVCVLDCALQSLKVL